MHGSHSPELYDFPEAEFDNADFELSLLVDNDATELPKPPEAQVLVEDLWQFVSLPSDDKQPPSSVLREFDRVSISTTTPKFDPNLQFSPPNSASPAIDEIIDYGREAADVISWDFVDSQLQHTNTELKPGYAQDRTAFSSITGPSRRVQPATPPSTARAMPAGMLLRPYKAWFHIREMLEAKDSMYKNQPAVKFELFARVVYTRRENFEKKQVFQLRDLFKIHPPYISGVLLN